MNFDVSIGWYVGDGVVRGIVDEVDSDVGDEFCEGVELEVWVKFASINI